MTRGKGADGLPPQEQLTEAPNTESNSGHHDEQANKQREKLEHAPCTRRHGEREGKDTGQHEGEETTRTEPG